MPLNNDTAAPSWNAGYNTLVQQMNAIQGQADLYKNASPLDSSRHINNIATSLARDYGITSLSDIGVRQVPITGFSSAFFSGDRLFFGLYDPQTGKQYTKDSPEVQAAVRESTEKSLDFHPFLDRLVTTEPEYFNKNDPTKIIPRRKFASEGSGEGYSNYNLYPVSDGKGGIIAIPVQKYSKSGFGEIAEDLAPLLAVAALAMQFIPGLGQAIGYAVLGAGDAIAGAALAGEIALATGVSSITAASVVSATGAATIAAGVTAAQGGDAEDVVRAAATAGSASITNVAAGGGIVGAGAGSAVGTAIAGGNLDNVTLNVVAAATGAAVSQQLGPGAGTIATSLVKTGQISDETLVRAVLAENRVEGTSQSGSSRIENLYDRLTAPASKEGSDPITIGNATYQELQDGSAKVTRGSNVTIMSPESFSDVKEEYLQNLVVTTGTDATTTIPSVEVTAGGENVVSPTVTDSDVIKQIETQRPTANLANVTITANTTPNVANVSPVITDLGNVVVTGGGTSNIANVSTTLDRVVVTGNATTDVANVSPVVTDLTPDTTTDSDVPAVDPIVEDPKKEEPKDDTKTPPSDLYPTVTSVPPPVRPGKQPIITGASPARLLADALAAYRPAGSVEGGESGKERQNVWNEKSLRLKDALGL